MFNTPCIFRVKRDESMVLGEIGKGQGLWGGCELKYKIWLPIWRFFSQWQNRPLFAFFCLKKKRGEKYCIQGADWKFQVYVLLNSKKCQDNHQLDPLSTHCRVQAITGHPLKNVIQINLFICLHVNSLSHQTTLFVD